MSKITPSFLTTPLLEATKNDGTRKDVKSTEDVRSRNSHDAPKNSNFVSVVNSSSDGNNITPIFEDTPLHEEDASNFEDHEVMEYCNFNRKVEDTLRFVAMLGMVGIGLLVMAIIFLWPAATIFVWRIATPTIRSFLSKMGLIALAEAIHISALVFVDFPYLYLHRKLFLPIRILLMPLLNFIVKSEGVRENATTWYNDCSKLPPTSLPTNNSCQVKISPILAALKSSARRDIKRKLRIYRARGITCRTRHSDHLSLQHDIPIIWNHEKRCSTRIESGPAPGGAGSQGPTTTSTTNASSPSVLEEFIKRFLMVFLISHAYVDRYYDSRGQFCALGMFVLCDRVYINNMYFCRDTEFQSGIWQYHHIRALLRATILASENERKIEFVNFYHHQDYAKKLAGALAADNNEKGLMKALFPFSFYREAPLSVIGIEIDLSEMDNVVTPIRKQN